MSAPLRMRQEPIWERAGKFGGIDAGNGLVGLVRWVQSHS